MPDPYPNERPDPSGTDPYTSDPYQPPAYEPGRSAPLPAPVPPPGAYPPPPYPGYAPQPTNVSAIILVIVSSLALVSGYCCVIGIPGLVFGILGLTQNSSDPESAARMTKIGWITVAVLTALVLLLIAAFIVFVIAVES